MQTSPAYSPPSPSPTSSSVSVELMTVREKIALFPHSPGVYRYYDDKGTVIYVGKAKDLHKRVAQYFVPAERLTRKTAILVSKIADAQYSVVDSEADALLLEEAVRRVGTVDRLRTGKLSRAQDGKAPKRDAKRGAGMGAKARGVLAAYADAVR